jgi:hypothetical protein
VSNDKGKPLVKQDYILQPDQFCKQNKLSAPYVFFNSSEGKKLYSNLATMASLPYVLFKNLKRVYLNSILYPSI